MKTILDIGGRLWLAPDMTTAGKIADALNKCSPINRDHRNSEKEVFMIGRGYEHRIAIVELSDKANVVKSLDAAIALRAKKDSKAEDLL
jgi:hypothetical protein